MPLEQLQMPKPKQEPPTVNGVLKAIRNFNCTMVEVFDLADMIDDMTVLQNEELFAHLKQLMTHSPRGY